MNAYLLKKTENQYELRIRGEPTTGSADDLRKRLTRCVREGKPLSTEAVAALDVGEELKICDEICTALESAVSEYEGDYTDLEGQRLSARMWHVHLRTARVPVGSANGEDVRSHEQLLERTKKLCDDANVKKASAAAEASRGKGIATQPVQHAPRTPVVSQPEPQPSASATQPLRSPSYHTKSVPVYKWGLTFDGQSQSVSAFLQRVEELRRARGVTEPELFDSAVDLFTGPALTWYRSISGRISNWQQLCRDMELVFQHPDHDIYLQQEIFRRVQAETEPIDLFVAAMEGLYSRLSTNVTEDVRLKQIIHNLHPQLQDRLALFDVTSIDQLRTMGRKAEAGRLRSSVTQAAAAGVEVLEPDLAYTPPRRKFNPNNARTTPERKVYQATNVPDVTCYNCHAKGHISRDCKERKETSTNRLLCWRCNKVGHIQRDCRVRLNPTSPRSGNGAGVSGVADTKPRH